LQWSV